LSIVFNYGDEGIFSSLLIVPPPIFIFGDIKELLEHGYKIIVESSGDQYMSKLDQYSIQQNISACGNVKEGG